MKSFTVTSFAALLISALAFTAAHDVISWRVDKAHSAINFSVRHFFTPVNGAFSEYDAEIKFDPQNPEQGSIDVTIQVKSIDTKNNRRNTHLQSDDFFGAETWPEIKFKSSSISSAGENKYVATGNLTIKDVTKEINLPFTLLGIVDHPMRENTQIAGITATTLINRNDYNVGTGDWASDTVVGDEVTVNISLELNSQSE